jgi:hypothetical protein
MAHPASYLIGAADAFPQGKSGRVVKLTTLLHLMPIMYIRKMFVIALLR